MWNKQNIVQTDYSDATDFNPNSYECQEYSWDETIRFDSKWNAASGLAYTAGIIGFIFTVLLIGTACAYLTMPTFYYLAAAFYVLAGMFDFLTLIGLQSNICQMLWPFDNTGSDSLQCGFSTGTGLAIGAGVAYLLTAVLVACIPRYSSRGKSDNDTDAAASDAKPKEALSKANQEGGDTVEGAGPATPEEKEEGEQEHLPHRSRGFWLLLCSNVLFLNGAAFYMWVAALDLEWARDVQEFHDAETMDKIKWWFRPAYESYDPDDYVFQTARGHWVSKYQIAYFIAAASFMIEGFGTCSQG